VPVDLPEKKSPPALLSLPRRRAVGVALAPRLATGAATAAVEAQVPIQLTPVELPLRVQFAQPIHLLDKHVHAPGIHLPVEESFDAVAVANDPRIDGRRVVDFEDVRVEP